MDLRKYQQEFVGTVLEKTAQRMLGVAFDEGISKTEAWDLIDKTLHAKRKAGFEPKSKVRYV